MFKLLVKFEEESGNEKSLVKNEIQIYECEKYSCINDSMFGIALNDKEAIMIPIRRIRDIKIIDMEE